MRDAQQEQALARFEGLIPESFHGRMAALEVLLEGTPSCRSGRRPLPAGHRSLSRLGRGSRRLLLRRREDLLQVVAFDDQFLRVVGCLEDDALLELVAATARWSTLSTVLRLLDVPLESGLAAWPPDEMAG